MRQVVRDCFVSGRNRDSLLAVFESNLALLMEVQQESLAKAESLDPSEASEAAHLCTWALGARSSVQSFLEKAAKTSRRHGKRLLPPSVAEGMPTEAELRRHLEMLSQ